MVLLNVVTIILFCLLLGAHILWRPFLERRSMLVLLTTILSIFTILIVVVCIEFKTIQLSPPPTQYFVPPFTPWTTYLQTVYFRVFAPYLLSFGLCAVAFALSTKWRFLKDRLYPSEALYIASAIFLMRHPYWLPYLASLLVLAILSAIYGTIRRGKEYRFSLHHLWIPSGILAALIIPWLSSIPFFNLIGFPNLY